MKVIKDGPTRTYLVEEKDVGHHFEAPKDTEPDYEETHKHLYKNLRTTETEAF